jgi:cytochrome c
MQLGCVACHSFNEGGKNGLGPNLYNVVGQPKAAHEGYSYSAALKGKGGAWSYEELNAWLTKPATFAAGTKMSFAGVPNAQTRANVIAYLRTLSASPVAMP